MTQIPKAAVAATDDAGGKSRRRFQIGLGVLVVVCCTAAYLVLPVIQVASWSKPSTMDGYRDFASLSDIGNSTPEAALETYHEALKNQSTRRLTRTIMKRLWNVPDDFDAPGISYSIELGPIPGPSIGYRIAHKEQLYTNQVRLTVDYEGGERSGFQQQRVLTQTNGVWRVESVKFTRHVPK